MLLARPLSDQVTHLQIDERAIPVRRSKLAGGSSGGAAVGWPQCMLTLADGSDMMAAWVTPGC
jgi:hypothetical protein